MKKKKILGGILSALIGISALSIVVNAQTIEFSLQMPSTGYTVTEPARKADNEDNFYLTITRLGWVEKGDGFLAYVVNPDGNQISKDLNFTREGKYNKDYKGSNAHYYQGFDLNCRLKTDWNTYHPCDVRGRFTP